MGRKKELMKHKNESLDLAARRLKVLGHATRLLILEALRSGEKSVTELEELVGGSQSNISQHLRLMRDHDILTARKNGNHVYYSVSDRGVFGIVDAVKKVFCRT